jgi:hypothetical protein
VTQLFNSGQDILIDDNGECWETGSHQLYVNLRCDRRDFDLANYAIRNLGFVRVRCLGPNLRITLRPDFLTRPAFETLAWKMSTRERTRFVVEVADEHSHLEMIPDLEDAVARIADLAAGGGAIIRPDFFCEELSLDRLTDHRRGRLNRLIKTWRALRGTMPANRLLPFQQSDLADRVVLVRMQPDQRGVIAHAGRGFTCFDSSWQERVIGCDLEEQPDPGYGKRVAASYRETHAVERPRLELVDAVIKVPGCPVRRSRYERLLLPWRSDGAMFVSSVSVIRTSFATGLTGGIAR